MSLVRASVAVVMVVMFIGSASCSPMSARSLEARSGCTSVSASRTMDGTRVVMAVVATDCAGDDPVLLAAAAAVLIEATWRSLRLPVDEVRVRLRGNVVEHAEIASRAELDRRFGSSPRGVVRSGSQPSWSDRLWLLLPVAYVVFGFGIFRLAQLMGQRGVFVIMIRR
jgi:hypothetical protein